jgi:hypothetical protein
MPYTCIEMGRDATLDHRIERGAIEDNSSETPTKNWREKQGNAPMTMRTPLGCNDPHVAARARTYARLRYLSRIVWRLYPGRFARQGFGAKEVILARLSASVDAPKFFQPPFWGPPNF